ncbi:hypothetical protein JL721_8756 [Aureococcus anophagefferens]|nr:hypothetical protein JL721_8756 [Aureococcus anophagefferens]
MASFDRRARLQAPATSRLLPAAPATRAAATSRRAIDLTVMYIASRAPPAAPQTTPTKRPRAAGESPFKATSPLATLPAAAQEELLAEFEDSSSDEEDDEVEEDETEEQGAEEGPAEEPEADGALFTCPNTTNIPPSDYAGPLAGGAGA